MSQGVRSALGRLNKATEYSSSSDEVGSSDEEERTRSDLHHQYTICIVYIILSPAETAGRVLFDCAY